jgi:hypothetical protein
MADATDSYSRWLDIPAEEQPPNHYRLLGVNLFEPDRAAIDAAAKRLMAHLQRNAVGDEAPAVRALLTEIANARVCLLTPQKRNDYDARLRSKLNSTASAQEASAPPSQPAAAAEPPAAAKPANVEVIDDEDVWIEDGGSVVAAIPLDEEPEDVAPEQFVPKQPAAPAQPIAASRPAATQPAAPAKPVPASKPAADAKPVATVKPAPKPTPATRPAAITKPAAAPARKPVEAVDVAQSNAPTSPVPAEAESEFAPPAEQGSFFADLGLGSGGGEGGHAPAMESWDSPASGAIGAATGAKTNARAASAAAGKAAFKSSPKSTAGFGAKSKGHNATTGQSKKKEAFKFQPWHLYAMLGGGVFVLILSVLIVSFLGGGDSNKHPIAKANSGDSGPPRFGPGSFTGTIDDITTYSPLGLRSAAQVPVERKGDLLLVDVKINGQDAGKFLIDTGTFDVIVSDKVANRLKLPALSHSSFQGPGGKQPSSERKIKSLAVGTGMSSVVFEDKMILPPRPKGDWTAVAADMKPWSDSLKLPISGVIGCDILYQMPVSINPLKKTLTFFNRHKFQLSNNQHPEFMSLVDSKPFMSASLDHAPASEKQMFLIATGAPTGVMVAAADRKVASLNVFGEVFADPPTEKLLPDTVYSTGDAREIGVVGSSVLCNFELLLDFQNSKILATRLAPK